MRTKPRRHQLKHGRVSNRYLSFQGPIIDSELDTDQHTDGTGVLETESHLPDQPLHGVFPNSNSTSGEGERTKWPKEELKKWRDSEGALFEVGKDHKCAVSP